MNKIRYILAVVLGAIAYSACHAHKVVCTAAYNLPSQDQVNKKLACAYHYQYKTRDGYVCFIQFNFSNDIRYTPSANDLELGKNAIQADIMGVTVSEKSNNKNIDHVYFIHNPIGAGSKAGPMYITFHNMDVVRAVDIQRLFNRKDVGLNLTLEELSYIVGPALPTLNENTPPLIDQIATLLGKIPNCSEGWPIKPVKPTPPATAPFEHYEKIKENPLYL